MTDISPPKLTLAQEKKLSKRRWVEKLKKYKQTEEIYKHHVLAPEYKPRLIDPSPMWREFVRQKQAFSFADSFKEDMHVFAVDVDETGQKRYFVTSYAQLRHTIFHWKGAEPPHFYEIIPQGAACHLYFDLEYSKEYNPDTDGVQMVDTFIKCVCHYLEELYDIKCTRRNIIDLDATTDSKFSRHLIFRIPGAAFKDNIHAGSFVHHVCTSIANHIRSLDSSDDHDNSNTVKESTSTGDSPKTKKQKLDTSGKKEEQSFLSQLDLQKLFIRNKEHEQILFVDQGVYTRNRNFRLFKCAKKGKQNALVLSEENQYKPSQSYKIPLEQQVFVDSIISNVIFNPKLRILECESEFVRRAVKLKESNNRKDGTEGSANVSSAKEEVVEGFYSSPYPDLDSFIRTQINQGGVKGEIRRWTYFSQGGLIVYDILKNRWCGNIGRQHKSNNIMVLVDLKQGVFYQKCHDPDCKAQNYKSKDQTVPSQYLPVFYDDLDDDELLKALEKMEKDESFNCHGNDVEEQEAEDIDDDTLLQAAQAIEHREGLDS